jgi:hypothetical protein
LSGIELIVNPVDERIAIGVGGSEEYERALIANFLAE